MKRDYIRPTDWDSFILYKSFYAPISMLPNEALGRLIRHLFQWQISGEAEPEQDVALAFYFIVNQFRIDDMKRMKKGETNRANILKRWNTVEYERIRSNTKNTSGYHNENENENENENACIDGADDPHHAPTHKRFVKPTLDQVREYCTSRGNNIDPVRFVDYYESIGWKVGKNPMKDWKACVRTWERQDHPQPCDDPGKVICGKAIDSLYDD